MFKFISLIKYRIIFSLIAFFSVTCLANDGAKIQPDNLFPRVQLDTPAGKIIVELDRSRAPITVNNFLAYAADGTYDGTIFHRVVADFVVQGGGYDQLYNPKKQNKPIFNESGNGLKNKMYTVGMARESNPHSATSQFYFNLSDNDNLDPGRDWGYTVFGIVVEGIEIIDMIGKAQTETNPQLGWENVPVKPILLKKATILKEE
ncbi:peptidylprolyl isomerase [Aliikangiella maris]|uniref:Peptidylprolyl isomerase n=2 Tax=Aliikangiella maris TaxID=3162458 RepID=A0ABV3MT37_9GAMM